MDCLSSTLEGGNNRKQVRFVSPLINHRQTSLLSPPPTPRLSPVLTPPQSPPLTLNTVNRKSLINNNSVHQRHLIPSRSLTNSPKRILQKEKLPEQFPQKSLALRFVKTLISHSQSYDSFQLSPKMSTTKQPKIITRSKQLTLPTSFSLNSIKSASSNSAIYQLILREERNRSFDEFNQKLQGNHRSSSSSSCPPPVAVSFPSKHRCCFHPEGVVLGHNSFEPSFSNSFNPLLLTNTTTTFNGGSNSSCGSGGVNIYSRAASAVLDETKKKKEKKRPPLLCHFHKPFESQKISSLFQSSQKRIFVWPPTFLSGQVKKRLPNSYTFPPPLIMNASPSHQQQQSYNELEDFDEDFVPRSSNASKINNKNSMEGHIEEKTQIRRMSLKEFSGLDLLEEHANQKAASNLSPMLHPWRSGQQLTLGSLIDKFSNRRRSSSSGGAKIEASLQHSHSEDGYNSFDRALDLINQAIRETINAGNAEQNSTNGSIEKNGKQASNHLEKQYSSTGRNTFGQTLQRLTNIRNHLNSTLQSVPNASPRKATSLEPDCEKLVLLNECKILVNACKDMIRNSNTSSPPTSQTSDLSLLQNCSNDCHMIVQIVVDSAERAIDSVEMLIRKSNSIFQAQQLTSNADQLLKALAEVVREVEKCQKSVKSNEQIKQLTRFSTVLTANLISFTELIRNI